MKKISDIIPISKQNIYNLGISLFAVSMFIFVGIIPTYIKDLSIDQNISAAQNKLKEHKQLLPMYTSLTAHSKQDTDDIIIPEDVKVERINLFPVLKTIQSIPINSGMTILEILPDLDYASKNPQSMAVSLSLIGKYENLRTTLIGFAMLPYIERVEEISIQQKPNTQMLAIKLQVMVAMP